jgi:hypothetical protein
MSRIIQSLNKKLCVPGNRERNVSLTSHEAVVAYEIIDAVMQMRMAPQTPVWDYSRTCFERAREERKIATELFEKARKGPLLQSDATVVELLENQFDQRQMDQREMDGMLCEMGGILVDNSRLRTELVDAKANVSMKLFRVIVSMSFGHFEVGHVLTTSPRSYFTARSLLGDALLGLALA